jgi:hypothetical protein
LLLQFSLGFFASPFPFHIPFQWVITAQHTILTLHLLCISTHHHLMPPISILP